MFTAWMGIDPGLKGGIAVQYLYGIPRAYPFPLTEDGKLDLAGISTIIDMALLASPGDPSWGYKNALIYIEDVHAMPGQGVTSMFNFGFGVGALHGMLTAKGLRFFKVNPIRWKNRVLQNRTKDKTVAIDFCKLNFPQVNLLPSGHRVAHDGMADALCISEYARKFHTESTAYKPSGTQKGKRAASSRRRA